MSLRVSPLGDLIPDLSKQFHRQIESPVIYRLTTNGALVPRRRISLVYEITLKVVEVV